MHLATTAKLNYPPVALLHCKATEATRTHLGARKPAPGKANGKRKGDLGPKADCKSVDAERTHHTLGAPARLRIQPPISLQSLRRGSRPSTTHQSPQFEAGGLW